MLQALALTLKSSFEGAIVIALLVIILKKSQRVDLVRGVIRGLAVLVPVTASLVFFLKELGGREVVDGIIQAMATMTMAGGLLVFYRWSSKTDSDVRKDDPKGIKFSTELFITLVTVLLTLHKGLDLALFPKAIFIMTTSVLNTELILKVGGGLVGVGLGIFAGISLVKSGANLTKRQVTWIFASVLVVLMFRQTVGVVQVLMAYGILPLTSGALAIMAPVINNDPVFFYFLVGIGTVIPVLAYRSKGKDPNKFPEGRNPAERRKVMAASRRQARWAVLAAVQLVLIGALIITNHAYANRKVELSPATPVTPRQGEIKFATNTVGDGNLHRFAYQTADGTEIRFLIIKKSSNLFGVVLDACEICGTAGYYQRGDQVICANCDVVINKPTIGFPGGCNPIPLKSVTANGEIVVKTADLDAKMNIFKK